MTVVAFDGKTVAADRRALNQGVPVAVTKISSVLKVSSGVPLIYAVTGDLPRALAILDWVKADKPADSFPPKDDKWGLVAIFTKDEKGPIIRAYENSPLYFETRTFPWAAGSGRDFALMAMHLGKTAAEAVELTNQLTVECGNGVDFEALR